MGNVQPAASGAGDASRLRLLLVLLLLIHGGGGAMRGEQNDRVDGCMRFGGEGVVWSAGRGSA